MVPTVVVAAAAALLSACAMPGADPRWEQRAGEEGRLATGRVLAVDTVGAVGAGGDAPRQLYQPATLGGGQAVGILPDTAALIAGAARQPLRVWRHTVRLRSGEVKTIDDEVRRDVGDCVALRSGPATLLVTARPGACD